MELWFLSNPALLKRERDAFDQLKKEAEWLIGLEWSLPGKLSVLAVIRVHGHDYKVRMEYPTYFPDSQPAVYPVEADRRWSTHQYGERGSLCLEWGPDNWLPEVTGADLIRSAYKLLSIENPMGNAKAETMPQAPTRHQLTMGQELRNKFLRCMITRNLKEFLQNITLKAPVPIRFSSSFHPNSWVVMFHQVEVPGQEVWKDSRVSCDRHIYRGIFIKATDYTGSLKDLARIEDFAKAGLSEEMLALHLAQAKEEKQDDLAILMQGGNGEFRFYLLMNDRKVYAFEPILEGDGINRMPAGYQGLAGKKVCIVGLGSLGSKIAITLARSGTESFYLVDHDLFLPDNVKRHALTWDQVGEHKVDGVQDMISKIDKNIKVETKCINLTGQESAAHLDVCLSKMSECDLIIDCTANERVFNLLCSVANRDQKKFLWAAVFEGGRGGQMGRFIPNVSAPPQVIRAAYNEFCLKNPSPIVKVAEDYIREDMEGRVIAASDADVSVIADNAARFAIDCLLEVNEYEFPMYLIGMGKWWVFRSPLEVIPIACGSVSQEKIEQGSELDEDGKNFLNDLIKKSGQA